MRTLLSAAFCFTLLTGSQLATGADGAGEDWPQFLGTRGNNTSSETGLLDKWPTNGPPVAWQKNIGSGYSAPSIRGELLILHHRVANEEVVEALLAANGKPVWRHAYPSRFVDPFGYNNGPRCTPLLTESRCYTFGAEGILACLDLKTGKLVWERATAKDSELTGGLYRAIAPRKQVYKPTEWNKYQVTLKGAQMKVVLNGELIQDLNLDEHNEVVKRHDGKLAPAIKDRPRKGHIGFQELSRGEGHAQIRHARIKVSE